MTGAAHDHPGQAPGLGTGDGAVLQRAARRGRRRAARRADQTGAADAAPGPGQGRAGTPPVQRRAPVGQQQRVLRQLPRRGPRRRRCARALARLPRPAHAGQHADGAQRRAQFQAVLERPRRHARSADRYRGAQSHRDGLELAADHRQAHPRRRLHPRLRRRLPRGPDGGQCARRHRQLRAHADHAECALRPLPARRAQRHHRRRENRLRQIQAVRLRGLPPGRQRRRQYVPEVRRDGRLLRPARRRQRGRPGSLCHHPQCRGPACVQGAQPAQRGADRTLLPRRLGRDAGRGDRRDVQISARPRRLERRQGLHHPVPEDAEQRAPRPAMSALSALRVRLGRLALPAVGLLLAAALMFTYLRSQDYDTAGYFENVALLRQIKQLDARWELDAMKSHIGLNQSYDPLVDPLRDMSVLPRHLDALATAQRPDAAGRLRAAIAAYELALNNKAALIEAFKSHNAVLRNSLTFLPIAVDDIEGLAGPRANAPVTAAANRVLLATLIYNQTPSDEEMREARDELAKLSPLAGRLAPELRQRVEILAMHAATVLSEDAVVAGLLNRIADVPTAARIDDINNLLGVEQQRAVQQLQTYRRFLSLLATALIGLLLYAAARLVRSHAIINRVNGELRHMNEHLEGRVRERTDELVQTNARLQTEMAERKQLESLLVQSEKLASIGQLSAGLFQMLAAYEEAEASVASAEAAERIVATRARVDLAYLMQDLPVLVAESRGGMDRVGKIVQDLKDFSHVDSEQDWQWADLRVGLASTFNIVASDLRHAADIVTDYGAMPDIECLPSQLNQVFMNLMLNAAQAIGPQRGRITIRTGCRGDEVWVEIGDSGCGIPAHVLPRIFDPFFTTKAIGKGTGLGLSLSYGIVQNHHGRIDVETAAGKGSTFRVTLPVRRALVAA